MGRPSAGECRGRESALHFVACVAAGLMRFRRSVRAYKSDPLPKEKIQSILEAGCLAPSAHNLQPWNFIVITNRDTINQLSFSAQEYLKKDTIFYGAPCVILVVVEKGNEYAPIDCGMMAQNMCLFAKEQGIASCIIGYARHIDHEELIKVGMRESQDLMFGMIFGYAAEDSSQEPDRDFNKVQKWIG